MYVRLRLISVDVITQRFRKKRSLTISVMDIKGSVWVLNAFTELRLATTCHPESELECQRGVYQSAMTHPGQATQFDPLA